MVNKQLLVNLASFFAVIPYVSIFPYPTDVQYPVIIACLLVILFDVKNKVVRINSFEVYFILISILSIFYINIFVDFNYTFQKRVALAASFLLFYTFSRYWHVVNPKYLLAGIYLNFFATMIQLFSPEIFEYFSFLIGRPFAANGMSDQRGLTGLAAEPAYLGGLSVAYILIGYILKNEGRIRNKTFYLLLLMSLILNALSMSGTAIFMLLVLSSLLILFSGHKIYIKIFFFIMVLVFFSAMIQFTGSSGRNAVFLSSLTSLKNNFLLNDYSTAMRGMSFAVGVQTLISGHILGHGVGTLDVFAHDLMADTYLHKILILADGQENNPYSTVGLYLFELGIFFLVLIVWLNLRTKKEYLAAVVRLTSILFIISAFSIVFPPFWILIAATDKRIEYTKNWNYLSYKE